MAAATLTHEFHTSIAPEKAFRCFIVNGANFIPKAIPNVVKTVEREAGRILKVTLVQGGHLKVKIDQLDTQNKTCKFTLIEGEISGKMMEPVTYEEKYEPSSNGGTVIKTKGCSEAEMVQAMSMFKATEAFVIANPAICA